MEETAKQRNSDKQRPRRRTEKMSYAVKGRFFKLRNILNTTFILLAIIGMAIYFYSDQFIGGAILVACVFIKLAECVLRIIR